MKSIQRAAAVPAVLAVLLSGCANFLGMPGMAGAPASPAAPPPPRLAPADVPAAVRAPQGQSVFLGAIASGAQIYECTALGPSTGTGTGTKADASAGFGWVFKSPEATLTDRSGATIGKHYAGPTWESVDGSTVTGAVIASDPGPDKSAIPWLLLTTKASTGAGVLTQTKTIQRLQTTGGTMPAQPCDAGNAKQLARVPYTAVYTFYRPS